MVFYFTSDGKIFTGYQISYYALVNMHNYLHTVYTVYMHSPAHTVSVFTNWIGINTELEGVLTN